MTKLMNLLIYHFSIMFCIYYSKNWVCEFWMETYLFWRQLRLFLNNKHIRMKTHAPNHGKTIETSMTRTLRWGPTPFHFYISLLICCFLLPFISMFVLSFVVYLALPFSISLSFVVFSFLPSVFSFLCSFPFLSISIFVFLDI